jgi:arginase
MISVIAVPYHLGQRGVAVGAGPLRLLETGMFKEESFSTGVVDAGAKTSWELVNAALTTAVLQARSAGSFPLVLAGNCNSCLGTLGALEGIGPGIVWFDAHGDFHSAQTSISGSIEGMSLTLATERYVPAHRVCLLGARDLEPGEAERVSRLLHHIRPENLPLEAPPVLGPLYVHIDIDVLDPEISPGVNFQGPGGLTPQQLLQSIAFVIQKCEVAALAITNYNPERDPESRTRDIIVTLIQSICDLRRTGPSR